MNSIAIFPLYWCDGSCKSISVFNGIQEKINAFDIMKSSDCEVGMNGLYFIPPDAF